MKPKNWLKKERVCEFLTSLKKDLDKVRGRILGNEPLPSTQEVLAEVTWEESRRKVMMGEGKDLAATSLKEH